MDERGEAVDLRLGFPFPRTFDLPSLQRFPNRAADRPTTSSRLPGERRPLGEGVVSVLVGVGRQNRKNGPARTGELRLAHGEHGLNHGRPERSEGECVMLGSFLAHH